MAGTEAIRVRVTEATVGALPVTALHAAPTVVDVPAHRAVATSEAVVVIRAVAVVDTQEVVAEVTAAEAIAKQVVVSNWQVEVKTKVKKQRREGRA